MSASGSAGTATAADDWISVFDLHHQFRIDYPALRLLDQDVEVWVLLAKPNEMGTRYYPHPLVENDEVVANTHYNSIDRYEYSAISRAYPGNAENFGPRGPVPIAPTGPFFAERVDKLRFAADMAALEKCTGVTVLDVILVKIRDGGVSDGAHEIKIRRQSYLRLGNGQVRKDEATYCMRIHEDFMTMQGTGAWHSQVLELIHGSSDRAVRHGTLMAGEYSDLIPQPGRFREPQRRPDMARAIGLVTGQVDPLNLRTGDNDSCAPCWREWQEIKCPILRTDCCRKLFCLDCLLTDSTSHGLNYRCPICRQGFFDEQAVKQVAFGLDRRGYYQRDDRFSDWENQEKSFADLDEKHPGFESPNADKIRVIPEMLCAAYLYVKHQAMQEPRSSTPKYQNPTTFPEFSIVEKSMERIISDFCRETDETKLWVTPWYLYHLFAAEFHHQCRQKYLDSPHAANLPNDESREFLEGTLNTIQNSVLRPGFLMFVSRLMRRTVNFLRYRVCRCEGVSRGHVHGDCRLYWSTWTNPKRRSWTAGQGRKRKSPFNSVSPRSKRGRRSA